MAVEIKNEKTEPAKGEIGKEFFDKLQDFMQSNFGEKQPRECPECIKCKDDSVPKYFSSLGSLKEHLLEHYKVKYYLENYRNKTKGRYIPWHDDYEPVSEPQLEKYMDKDIFADYLERVEDEREAKREEKRRREEKMLKVKSMVERDRERRQKEFDKKVKSNSDLFNEDTDSESENFEPRKIKYKSRKTLESSDSEDDRKKRKRVRSVDSRKSIVEPKKRKPLTPAAQLQMHKLEFEEFLKEFDLPKKVLCPFCCREYGQAVAEEHISQCD